MGFLSRFYVRPVRPLGLDISTTEPARGQMRAGADLHVFVIYG
jgi:hypothetical protein